MKKSFKAALVTFVLLATVLFVTACSGEETPYEKNDADGYTVSIKYDANGGFFATSTSVVVDSYNISGLTPNANGKVQLGLLAPEDSRRGSTDTFTATKNGYFLEGWYTERYESTDSEGNTVYTYANKWDFNTDVLDVDPNQTYTSSEPVLTLYAAWVPMFEVNFIDRQTNEVVGTYAFNPQTAGEIKVPQWSEKTGKVEMFRFAAKKGYTFDAAFYDAEGTQPIENTVIHTGVIKEDGTAENYSMNVYVDYLEGEWYHIYNAEQLKDNASPMGNYILEADLDFADTSWPTIFATGNFTGSIQGNGHTIKNVTLKQTNTGASNMGLFGQLMSGAKLENVTFENVTFTIEKGFVRGSANYGLLAGIIGNEAVLENVQILSSTLQIDSGVYFGTEDYGIGLICGLGDPSAIVKAEITCQAVGAEPEKLTITVDDDGNTVTVQFA